MMLSQKRREQAQQASQKRQLAYVAEVRSREQGPFSQRMSAADAVLMSMELGKVHAPSWQIPPSTEWHGVPVGRLPEHACARRARA